MKNPEGYNHCLSFEQLIGHLFHGRKVNFAGPMSEGKMGLIQHFSHFNRSQELMDNNDWQVTQSLVPLSDPSSGSVFEYDTLGKKQLPNGFDLEIYLDEDFDVWDFQHGNVKVPMVNFHMRYLKQKIESEKILLRDSQILITGTELESFANFLLFNHVEVSSFALNKNTKDDNLTITSYDKNDKFMGSITIHKDEYGNTFKSFYVDPPVENTAAKDFRILAQEVHDFIVSNCTFPLLNGFIKRKFIVEHIVSSPWLLYIDVEKAAKVKRSQQSSI